MFVVRIVLLTRCSALSHATNHSVTPTSPERTCPAKEYTAKKYAAMSSTTHALTYEVFYSADDKTKTKCKDDN